MKVRDGHAPLRSGWWLVALGTLLGLAAAQLVIAFSTPVYRSSTDLFVGATNTAGTAATDPTATAYTGGLFTQARVASYVQLIEGERLSSEVIGDLRLPMTPAQLAGHVTGTVVPNTVVLRISVTDSSARRAQAIAASYGRHVISDVSALERPDPTAPSAVHVSTLQPATYDATAVSPDTARDYGLGALVGLLLGLALAGIRWRMRRRVTTVDDVEAATGTAVLAAVPRGARRPLAADLDPQWPGPEALRRLRTRLYDAAGTAAPGIVVVTGAVRGDGATTAAAQLAAALAGTGRKVLIVDADLRRSSLSHGLGLSGAEGLADVLAGTADETAVIHDRGDGRPAVLPAGTAAPGSTDSGEPFAAPKMRALLDTLRTAYDAVVIDAPPVLPDGEACLVGALGDGCLLVSRHGSSRRKPLAEAAGTLSWYGVAVLGAVLTGMPERQALAHGGQVRYAADPSRARMEGTGTVHPTVPFSSAAPSREDDRPSPEPSPAGALPS